MIEYQTTCVYKGQFGGIFEDRRSAIDSDLVKALGIIQDSDLQTLKNDLAAYQKNRLGAAPELIRAAKFLAEVSWDYAYANGLIEVVRVAEAAPAELPLAAE